MARRRLSVMKMNYNDITHIITNTTYLTTCLYLFIMAERTLCLKPLGTLNQPQIRTIFQEFGITRIGVKPETNAAFIEFQSPQKVELFGSKYPDCRIANLNNAEVEFVDQDFVWENNFGKIQLQANQQSLPIIEKAENVKEIAEEVDQEEREGVREEGSQDQRIDEDMISQIRREIEQVERKHKKQEEDNSTEADLITLMKEEEQTEEATKAIRPNQKINLPVLVEEVKFSQPLVNKTQQKQLLQHQNSQLSSRNTCITSGIASGVPIHYITFVILGWLYYILMH